MGSGLMAIDFSFAFLSNMILIGVTVCVNDRVC